MKNNPKARVSLGVVAGLLAGAAAADTIHLRNGNKLEGEARVLANGDVEVHSAMGVWTVAAARVLQVVESESAEERVARALSRRPEPDVDELFDLAVELRAEGAATLSQRLLERLVTLDPEHAEARRLLGQRKLGDEWVSEEEYRLAKGEIFYRGQWTDAESAAKMLELEALEASRERAEAERRYADAQRELVYQEQLLRLEELSQEPYYGFPVDDLWGWGWGWWGGSIVTDPGFDGDHRPGNGRPGHGGRPGMGPRPTPQPSGPARAPAQRNSSAKIRG
jgi:hypothetical protein